MPLFTLIKGQDLAGQQTVPVLFVPLNGLGLIDPDQPGILQPFRGDLAGNLLVALGGAAGPILLPDDVDGVAPVATNDRVPTVARLIGFNPGTSDYDRIRTDDDEIEASAANEDNALIRVMTRGRVFNNADDTWRRVHGNDQATLAPSASRSATTIFGPFTNTNWRAAHFIVDVTVIPADDIVVNIEAENPATGTFYPILTAAAIAATGTTVLKVGVGFTPVVALTANNILPFTYRVNVVHSGGSAITYSIGANFGV